MKVVIYKYHLVQSMEAVLLHWERRSKYLLIVLNFATILHSIGTKFLLYLLTPIQILKLSKVWFAKQLMPVQKQVFIPLVYLKLNQF